MTTIPTSDSSNPASDSASKVSGSAFTTSDASHSASDSALAVPRSSSDVVNNIPFAAAIPGDLPGTFTTYGLYETGATGVSFRTPELPGLLPTTCPFALCTFNAPENGPSSPNYVTGVGWELKVFAGSEDAGTPYTYMTTVPRYESLSFNVALNNEGAGQVVIDFSDAVFSETLSTGGPGTDLLDYENFWQCLYNGEPIFEFLGTTVEQVIVDASSEAQPITISGAGTARTLQWACAQPPGFPNVVYKLAALADTFQVAALNTTFWNLTPATQITSGQVYVDTENAMAAILPTATTYLSSPVLSGGVYDATSSALWAQITPCNMPVQPTNLMPNYDFLLGLTGWNSSASAAQAGGATVISYNGQSFDGSGLCAQVTTTAATQGVQQTVPGLNADSYYQVNAWVNVQSTTGHPQVTLYDSTNSVSGYPGVVATTVGEWSLIQASIKTGGTGNINLICSINGGSTACQFLVDTTFLYEFTPYTSNAMLLQSSTAPTSNYVMMELDLLEKGARFWATVFENGTPTSVALTTTYDPVQHNYWRIREYAGTFFFDTAPDGATWTNQGSLVYNWSAESTQVTFTTWYYGGYGSTPGFSPMEIGNINVSGTPAVLANGQQASTVNPGSYTNYNLAQGNGVGLDNAYLEIPNAALWLDLLTQSQRRNMIPFVTPTFTTTTDSFDVPWSDVASLIISNGTDLESQFQASVVAFNGDWLMLPGFQLVAGNDGSLGNDLSSTVVFHSSGEISNHTRTRARDQIANYVVAGDGTGNLAYQTSGNSSQMWTNRETFIQSSQATDIPTLTQMANAALQEFQFEISQRTLQVPAEYPGHTVFVDYHLGDWIGVQNPNLVSVDRVRVVGASISIDGTQDFVTVELTLETRIQLFAERMNVLLQKIGANADAQVIAAPGASSTVVLQSVNSVAKNTFTQVVGDTVTSQFYIGHGLNTQNVTVTVVNNSTGAQLVPGSTTYTVTGSSLNQLTVNFNSPPASNEYTVVVKK